MPSARQRCHESMPGDTGNAAVCSEQGARPSTCRRLRKELLGPASQAPCPAPRSKRAPSSLASLQRGAGHAACSREGAARALPCSPSPQAWPPSEQRNRDSPARPRTGPSCRKGSCLEESSGFSRGLPSSLQQEPGSPALQAACLARGHISRLPPERQRVPPLLSFVK